MQNVRGLPEVLRAYVRPSGSHLSDETLLAKVAAGDRCAMEALFRRHCASVYRFVVRLSGDAALAEDTVSETFLEVWKSAQSFAGRSQVLTWLLAIARHKALSAVRGRSAFRQGDLEPAVPSADDPEVSVYRKDRSKILRACLGRLSPAHREILDLVYYHEKSIEEVAHILATPAGTVKTRIFYARRYLAEFLKLAGVEGTQESS
jgi:RNA polymerase sigma-70 factor, ECF subfamily